MEDDAAYVGLPSEQARALADQRGENTRVIQDGSLYRLNLVPARLNLVVAEGIVIRTWRG